MLTSTSGGPVSTGPTSTGETSTGLTSTGLTSNGYVLDDRPDRLGPLEPVPESERGSRQALRQRLVDRGYLFLTGQIGRASWRDRVFRPV